MKCIAILIILNGITYLKYSINNLSAQEAFKMGSKLFDSSLWHTGVILGALCIVSGIGILLKKRFAYYLTILVYLGLIIYAVISLIYIIITVVFDGAIVALLCIQLVIFYAIIHFVRKQKDTYI